MKKLNEKSWVELRKEIPRMEKMLRRPEEGQVRGTWDVGRAPLTPERASIAWLTATEPRKGHNVGHNQYALFEPIISPKYI